jgi:hypothetical protein
MMRALLLATVLVGCGGPDEDAPPIARPYDCGVPTAFSLEVTAKFHEVCMGAEQVLSANAQRSCGAGTSAATDPIFSSSDPLVIKIVGNRAIAAGFGAAEVTARAEGLVSEPILLRVGRCADAGD